MKNIRDDETLANMDQKDLEKTYLKLKKTIELREKRILSAIKDFDLVALKEALKNNKDRVLPPKAWDELSSNINNLNYQNLNFFLFMRSLPDFQKHDETKHLYSTITEQAVRKSFELPDLFNFFCNHKDFFPVIKKIADDYAFLDTISKDIIHNLFKYEVFKPTKKVLKTVLEEDCFNYLEYFWDNNLYKFKESDYRNIYENIWKDCDLKLLNKVKESYPAHNLISLSELLEKNIFLFNCNDKSKEQEEIQKVKYLRFITLNEEVFSRTLSAHKIDKQDVLNIVKTFDSTVKASENNFHYFIKLVVRDYPEYCTILQNAKSTIKSSHLRPIYKKAMDYVDLNVDLGKQPIEKKKLKI